MCQLTAFKCHLSVVSVYVCVIFHLQVDSHADGVNFNEFIAAMFDAQNLAKAEVAKLVSTTTQSPH